MMCHQEGRRDTQTRVRFLTGRVVTPKPATRAAGQVEPRRRRGAYDVPRSLFAPGFASAIAANPGMIALGG
jgi:hypothetical protein